MKRSHSPVGGGLRRWRKANLQIVKRYVKVCSSSQSSFFDSTTIEEVMATWLLSEEVFESNRHFDDRQSWESVQEFTQVCTTEWIAFRKSVQEWIIYGVQNQVSFEHLQRVWLHLHQGRAAVALLMDSSMNSGLDFASFMLVASYFTNVSTWSCN